MPKISVLQDELFNKLGRVVSLDYLDSICFELGIEYDGIEPTETEKKVLKFEIPANRYDLLCVEGLTTALLAYKWDVNPSKIEVIPAISASSVRIRVGKECSSFRPYILGVVLRGINLTAENYRSLIDLQEKLHQGLCRRRTIAAIGIHDLDSIKTPLTYTLEKPESIVFSPLTDGAHDYNSRELLKIYEGNGHLKPYLEILENQKLYPVVRDADGDVCSFPPIINSHKSEVTLNTRNMFIEVTAVDEAKGKLALNQIVASFSQYCDVPFMVESVTVEYEDRRFTYPDLKERALRASVPYISTLIGVENLTALDICNLLKKMMISCVVVDRDIVEATIPITRPDIQHPCDLAEDVAIAYGYNNIPMKKFPMGRLRENTIMANSIRFLLANCGYKETVMPILDSFKGIYHNMCHPVPSDTDAHAPVVIHNSKVAELEIIRVSLIPGLLKTVFNRKATVLPIRIYEIGEVVWRQEGTETGTVNNTKCACAYSNSSTAGLEEIQGVSEILLGEFGFYSEYQLWELKNIGKQIPESWKYEYKLEETNDPTFLNGRVVSIKMSSEPFETIGIMGTIHPNVLRNFHIATPVSVFELNLTIIRTVTK